MLKIAFYGKGGIGKSTTTSNVAAALARKGLTVLQIGCDPKADSTLAHHGGVRLTPLLERFKREGPGLNLHDAVYKAPSGVLCVEAGGPTPGLGCAGRGIGMVLEFLQKHDAVKAFNIDCVLYDVLGDVVCGGFSLPMRQGYANEVLICTSAEAMSLYAAENIAKAVENFKGRGYAKLAGFVHIEREHDGEDRALTDLSGNLGAPVLSHIPNSPLVNESQKKGELLIDAFPESDVAAAFHRLADLLWSRFGEGK
ncbi:MAG: AAA family ATPase [Desulfovibrio sp.]|nr:AAA family ATPase [Desulfovibrio sp.]